MLLDILQALVAIPFLVFIPGFLWTLVLLKRLPKLERVLLSVGLTITTVVLLTMTANYALGIRLTGVNLVLITAVNTAIPALILGILTLLRRSR